MTAHIIDGRKIANDLLQTITRKVAELAKKQLPPPGLAVILIGDDEASKIYVKNKQQACEKTGITSFIHHLDNDVSETELLSLIDGLNKDETVHGILVQLPLPAHINSQKVIEKIIPIKDVDGFHPYNLGRLAQRCAFLQPCTPYGVMKILEAIGINPEGMHAVVVGASNIVGRPMAYELIQANATVTICHRKTNDLSQFVKQADLLVAAVGSPNLIKGEWIKPGAIVIDIGITRLANGTLAGDIEFDVAKEKASWITPVPGGVGPMTVAMLMYNTLYAYNLL